MLERSGEVKQMRTIKACPVQESRLENSQELERPILLEALLSALRKDSKGCSRPVWLWPGSAGRLLRVEPRAAHHDDQRSHGGEERR